MRPGGLSTGLLGSLLLWVLGLAGLCVLLLPQWASNPELAHGYLMPLVCLLLVGRSQVHGTRRHPTPGPLFKTSLYLLGLGALLCTAFGGLYALGFGWDHPLACGSLTLGFVLLSLQLASALASAGVLSLNWQLCCAAGLWLLCSPLPPGTYARASVQLQLGVTGAVLDSLHFLGIAAVRHGNVIELVRGSVGVEEACSGIQSLITCLFAAVLLSAWFPRAAWRRSLLVLTAVPVALGMNFARSLTLSLLTAAGTDIRGFWHDWTGYGVLGIATLLLILTALALEEKDTGRPPAESRPPFGPDTRLGLHAFVSMLPALLLTGTLVFNSHGPSPAAEPGPDLARLIPAQANGWQVYTEEGIHRFQYVLKADAMLQREYVRLDNKGQVNLVLYVASWNPGNSNPGLVALHTPDVCWPGAGWTELETGRHDTSPLLRDAEQRRFLHAEAGTQYVWYWHLHGGRPVKNLNPYRPFDFLQLTFHYRLGKPENQLFIRVSSNRPWNEIIDAEPLTKLLQEAGIYGLSATRR